MKNIKTELTKMINPNKKVEKTTKILEILNETYHLNKEKISDALEALTKSDNSDKIFDLPLNIQLYGTWSGHLDEMVFENERVSEVTDTGINIKEAPSDLIYFFYTIECDGKYGEDVDLVADRVWSGVTIGVLGRDGRESYEGQLGQLFTATYYSYRDTFNPQDINDIHDYLSVGVGITLLTSGETVRFVRTVQSGSYYTHRIMGGNYTVNVYALKLGNL